MQKLNHESLVLLSFFFQVDPVNKEERMTSGHGESEVIDNETKEPSIEQAELNELITETTEQRNETTSTVTTSSNETKSTETTSTSEHIETATIHSYPIPPIPCHCEISELLKTERLVIKEATTGYTSNSESGSFVTYVIELGVHNLHFFVLNNVLRIRKQGKGTVILNCWRHI